MAWGQQKSLVWNRNSLSAQAHSKYLSEVNRNTMLISMDSAPRCNRFLLLWLDPSSQMLALLNETGQMVPIVPTPWQTRQAVLSAKLPQTARWNRGANSIAVRWSGSLCSLRASIPSFCHHKETNPWECFAWGFRNQFQLPLWQTWGGSQSSAFVKKEGERGITKA